MLFRKPDDLFRAEGNANLTALTADRVNPVSVPAQGNGSIAAQIPADPARGTLLLLDPGQVSGIKRYLPFVLWLQDKVQIRSIHIQVANDFVAGKMGKCCRK